MEKLDKKKLLTWLKRMNHLSKEKTGDLMGDYNEYWFGKEVAFDRVIQQIMEGDFDVE